MRSLGLMILLQRSPFRLLRADIKLSGPNVCSQPCLAQGGRTTNRLWLPRQSL